MHPRATLLALSLAIVAAACGSSSTTSTAPATVPRCGVTLATTDLTVPASGGTGRIAITTARECAWTANSNAAWLTVTGPSSGQGDGVIEYSASSNNDPTTRRALIELNDQKANVTQAGAACTMALGDTSESFSPAGGSGTIPVQASSPSCPWTAVSDSSWITIRSGASGSGNGTVAYDVAAGSGPPRTGTILAAGLRFAITQSEGCTFAIGANSYSPGPSGGATTIPVSAAAGCPWTAISNVPWITVPQGAAGSGAGAARLVVESTSGPPRTGTVLVAGQTVTVTQGGGCDFVVAPLFQPFASNGGSGSATIEAGGGRGWTATSNAPWITLTGPTSGTGGGAITFTVAPLTGAARSGTITAAGVTITVSQGSGCTFAIAPTSVSLPASGGGGTVSVTAGADCAWTATSGVSWLSIAGGASGTGNGTVQFTAAATTGGPPIGHVDHRRPAVHREPGQRLLGIDRFRPTRVCARWGHWQHCRDGFSRLRLDRGHRRAVDHDRVRRQRQWQWHRPVQRCRDNGRIALRHDHDRRPGVHADAGQRLCVLDRDHHGERARGGGTGTSRSRVRRGAPGLPPATRRG